MKQKSIMIIAGEISGDMHAAALLRALQRQGAALDSFGVGGDELRAAGMQVLYDIRQVAVLGFSDVLRNYFFFRRVFNDLLALARARRPEVILLVDYPGFNLRFAARAQALGLKVVYYICPQVWAWHRARAHRLARIVQRLITIFPFEKAIFAGSSLAVDFVGHPLVAAARAALTEPLLSLPGAANDPRIALLPGSRYHEIRRILPVMWAAATLLERQFPGAAFIVAAPSAQVADWIKTTLAAQPHGPACWSVVIGQTRQVLRQARAAMVTSGTATIEAALLGCPMVVVYKTSWLTYALGRLVIRVPFLGMVNLVAGYNAAAPQALCPEFIQHRATPSALATGLAALIADGAARQQMLQGLAQVAEALGEPGADERAAQIIRQELR